MSSAATSSEKSSGCSFPSLSRSKNSSYRSANEYHEPSIPKNSSHQRTPSSKDPLKEIKCGNPSFSTLSREIMPEREDSQNKRPSIPRGSKSYYTPRVTHKKTTSRKNKSAIQLDNPQTSGEQNIYCVSELRSALNNLNTVSNNINRRLDTTYYSVLEKLSSLQCTIMGLRELSAMTRQLNVKLVSECNNVAHECDDQLDSFGEFHKQATRIKQLKRRVDVGRQNFLCLGERVKHVRKRVERWEMTEQEWKNRLRRRLKIMWSCLGTFLTLTLAIYALPWWMAKVTDAKLVQDATILPTNASLTNRINLDNTFKDTFQVSNNLIGEMKNPNWDLGECDDVPRGFN